MKNEKTLYELLKEQGYSTLEEFEADMKNENKLKAVELRKMLEDDIKLREKYVGEI